MSSASGDKSSVTRKWLGAGGEELRVPSGPLSEAQKSFINAGRDSFQKRRLEWCTGTGTFAKSSQNDDNMALSSTSSSSSSSSSSHSNIRSHHGSAKKMPRKMRRGNGVEDDEDEDEEDEDDDDDDDDDDESSDDEYDEYSDLDIQAIMQCLKNYMAFPKPIKLGTMVDILTVLWEDEDD